MNNFLKFHMEDKKEDMKKKWKILEYLDSGTIEEIGVVRKPDISKKTYSISRLRQIFKR